MPELSLTEAGGDRRPVGRRQRDPGVGKYRVRSVFSGLGFSGGRVS
jgi:hypothetical protein